MATENTLKTEYDKKLKEFVSLCLALNARGMPYLSVQLSHELYRFLYPSEPYAGFRHTHPLTFVVNKISALMNLGKNFSKTVVPYPFDKSLFREEHDGKVSLETSTSDLYSSLWENFKTETVTKESHVLLRKRLPLPIIHQWIKKKTVLDMGCGSGRYSIALALAGAHHIDAVDFQSKAYRFAERWCCEKGKNVRFHEANVHQLPFASESFDFVFCNGVLHHTSSIAKGLSELHRVLRRTGRAFLYLYASGGVFWETRRALRRIFRKIPIDYTTKVLAILGMPPNRFIFCDTWYVPTETHTSRKRLETMLSQHGFVFKKIVSTLPFDLDRALIEEKGGAHMWGDGDHRYLLQKR